LLEAAVGKLSQAAPPLQTPTSLPLYRPKQDPRDYLVARAGEHQWRLAGAAIERAAAMTFWEHDGSVRRFQKIMEALGVDAALRKAGIQNGDTVVVGEFELDWQD
jgi:GTP-binding protein